MISLIIALVVLVIIVLIARAILGGLGAPAFLNTVVTLLAVLVAIYLVAQFLGFATPSLK